MSEDVFTYFCKKPAYDIKGERLLWNQYFFNKAKYQCIGLAFNEVNKTLYSSQLKTALPKKGDSNDINNYR